MREKYEMNLERINCDMFQRSSKIAVIEEKRATHAAFNEDDLLAGLKDGEESSINLIFYNSQENSLLPSSSRTSVDSAVVGRVARKIPTVVEGEHLPWRRLVSHRGAAQPAPRSKSNPERNATCDSLMPRSYMWT